MASFHGLAKENPLILLLGYWPPTAVETPAVVPGSDPPVLSDGHGMLFPWRERIGNYLGSGFDVLALGPTFPELPRVKVASDASLYYQYGAGEGAFRVDYASVSRDFWRVARELQPVAVLGHGLAEMNRYWQLHGTARNLAAEDWVTDFGGAKPPAGGSCDDGSPYSGVLEALPGLPPDPTLPAGAERHSNLPYEAILAGIHGAFPNGEVEGRYVAEYDASMRFLCGYMTYHAAWYREYSTEAGLRPCRYAGFVHVGREIPVAAATRCVEIEVQAVLDALA
jgi:hypothetical protein